MPLGPVPLPPADLRIADLAGRRVGVWGAGREGAAAIRALAAHAPGSSVVVASSSAPPDGAAPLPDGPDGRPPRHLHGAEGLAALAACEVVIRSPGVPVRGPEADAVRAGGATLTSGTALWLAERGDRETVVGITGTKGKSTTSSLLHHLLGKAGVRSVLAGNIGRPLLDQLRPSDPPEAWVVELSSYQLADLPRAPTIAVVTNLMRDHLPWHGDEATYHADKLRILTAGDGPRMAVLSYADPGLRSAAETLPHVPILWVDHPDGLHVAGGEIREGARVLCPIDALPLRGVTGARNVCAALEAVRALGYEVADLAGALRDFRPLPHRQQVVAAADGRTWVDDSISTTPEAALSAVAAFGPGPLVLIAGGDDRRQRYDALARALATGRVPTGAVGEPLAEVRIAGVVTLPGTGPALAEAVADAAREAGRTLPVRQVDGDEPGAVMVAAVAAARELAPAGATVLLSPAAPSHNLFRDFEDRGDRFAAAVAGLG
ncbi:UDP-N-acetylmuramoyl-L-alanine--D-glutamate ligase [Patulibacter medicamentivorans]|uniref:UDP-N-acetylmuramoyl-L-alanine--D-glutamate ligase n=1 Tax=Patulibacter medicamentivorans TaxID=1097667 RepID=UPI000681D168|nr:UDP-N-acetylmuramoyl-L-alanine--D-glutamate ligase [Patulibacter medicamentivorans]